MPLVPLPYMRNGMALLRLASPAPMIWKPDGMLPPPWTPKAASTVTARDSIQ